MSWLPDEHLPVVLELAQIDKHLRSAADAVYEFVSTDLFELDEQIEGGLFVLRVVGVKPLAPSIALDTADAINLTRNMLEHTLYRQVQIELGRDLTKAERRAVEMPACTTPEAFNTWCNRKRQQFTSGLFDVGAPLRDRVESLQPFVDPDSHPLRVLIESSNESKHRQPLVSVARVSKVVNADHFDQPDGNLFEADRVSPPVRIGDIISSKTVESPPLPLEIWPEVSIQRPDGTYRALGPELRKLESWARTVAVPTIIGAPSCVVSPLPVTIPIDRPVDLREAIDAAGPDDFHNAFERLTLHIQADLAKTGLLNLMVQYNDGPDERFVVWLCSLSDTGALTLHEALGEAISNPWSTMNFVEQLIVRATD